MSDKPTSSSTSDLPPSIGRVALRELAVAGYTRLEQIARVTDRELLRLHGVGPKAVRILREELASRASDAPAE